MRRIARLMCMLLAACMLVTVVPVVSASTDTPVALDSAGLAEQYAPMLYFKNGERCFPVAVEYFIQNSNLNRSNGGTPQLIDANPTVAELATYFGSAYSEYYLDNRLGSVNDDRIIKAYQEQESALGYTVYYRVTQDASTGSVIIQYWFFYVFNPATYNNHEGDWEMVQVVLDPSLEPVEAMYSQHESGMRADWSMVDRSDDNIKVYVALGSHANYYRPYQGKTGLAQDTCGDDGKKLTSDDYELVDIGSPAPAVAWTKFGGHWGDYGSITAEFRGQRGPLGPAYRQSAEMWSSPIIWGEGLTSLNSNMLLLDQLYTNFIWIVVAFLLLGVLLLVLRILKRRKNGESLMPFWLMMEIKGTDKRSVANIIAIVAVVIAIIAAFMPYYTATVNIPSGQYQTPGDVEVLRFSGVDGLLVNGVDDQGVPYQLAAIALPFGMLIFLSMAMLIIGTMVARRKKVPGKYISKGITLIVTLILILVIVGSIASLEPMFHQIEGGDGAVAIIQEIAKMPMGGTSFMSVPDYGQVQMEWGIGIGAWLFLLAGVMLLAAGLLYRMARKDDAPAAGQRPAQ